MSERESANHSWTASCVHTPVLVPVKASEPLLRFMQTADEVHYRPTLELTSRTVLAYCELHRCNYSYFLGVMRGSHPSQATYNRILLLKRLADTGYPGWACYMDADAFIADLSFDLRKYLADKADVALIAAPGGGPLWWQVNSGVVLINLGHRCGRVIVDCWWDAFQRIDCERLRAATQSHEAADDQTLLWESLRSIPGAERAVHVDRQNLLNYDGRFIQHLGSGQGTLRERLAALQAKVQSVLAATSAHRSGV